MTHLQSFRIPYVFGLLLCLIIPVSSNHLLSSPDSDPDFRKRNPEADARRTAPASTLDARVATISPVTTAPMVDCPQQSAEVIGQWSSVITLPIVAIHMHLLPNGKVFLFQDDDKPNERKGGSTKAYIWDVNTDVRTSVENTTKNVFCSGHAFLPDGRLLIAGGHTDQGDNYGLADAFIFDSANNTWIQTNHPMALGRWYPTAVTLANGEVLVVSGNVTPGNNNNQPDVWETNSGGGWRQLTNIQLNLYLYPYLHLAPNGQVFISGPERTTRYMNAAGSGTLGATFERFYNANRDYGSSVMYDAGKVVIIGGGTPPLSTAEAIDLNAGSPEWHAAGTMGAARTFMNATVLADGKVLVTGGTSLSNNDEAGGVLTAELWNPATESFTTMACMAKKRQYHGTAILLPDGRVLSAGSGRPGTEQRNAEIYSPPYLFTTGGAAAVRPTIDSHISQGMRPGQTLFVTTPDAASVSSVSLVRLSSVTHARDMNQRFNHLSFTQAAGGLNVTMPANANVCPPGHYMLFILNSNGVPSVARIISVDSNNALPPSAPGNLTATATSTFSVSLTWNSSTGSVDHYEVQRSTNRNGPFTTLSPNASGTSYTDSSVTSNTTYIYRVRAVDAQGNYSDFSNSDIATTIIFADDPLVAGVTVVKAQHLTELRQAVNAVRLAAGLSAATWTDSAPQGVVIQAVHINELRSNLDQARSLLGLSTGSYTDPTLATGVTVVKAVHVQELRDRVK